ncbi:MAG: C39 family peptidase, partial [Candidatus Thorarchaeota archaeon]
NYGMSADAGEVTGVPYVWQELNGFCHWATLSMALHSIGIQFDLAEVLAASGAGFTAGYVRYEDFWLFSAGSGYRQQSTLETIADILGFEVEFYLDTDSTDFGTLFALTLQTHNVNWTEIDGWDDAIEILKDSIDSGFPVAIYANLQNLPASDYDLFRDLGITDTNPTHSILITGYNETSSTAQVMDPAIGLFDDPASFPDDGNWFYEVDYSSLNQAWIGCYAMTIIKPGTGTTADFTQNLANYILDRLRGNRNSYAPGSEDVYFWNYGSNAFRAMAADLTGTGLSSYINEFEEYNLYTQSIILQDLGMQIETTLTQQFAAYQAAIDALPRLLPDLDLEIFVSECKLAFEHFELFSDNSTVNTPFYTGGEKMVTRTFENIANQYVLGGDLSSAVSVNEEDLAEIRNHLTAIADIWDTAADALERALQGPEPPPIILLSTSIAGIVVLVIVICRRKN